MTRRHTLSHSGPPNPEASWKPSRGAGRSRVRDVFWGHQNNHLPGCCCLGPTGGASRNSLGIYAFHVRSEKRSEHSPFVVNAQQGGSSLCGLIGSSLSMGVARNLRLEAPNKYEGRKRPVWCRAGGGGSRFLHGRDSSGMQRFRGPGLAGAAPPPPFPPAHLPPPLCPRDATAALLTSRRGGPAPRTRSPVSGAAPTAGRLIGCGWTFVAQWAAVCRPPVAHFGLQLWARFQTRPFRINW